MNVAAATVRVALSYTEEYPVLSVERPGEESGLSTSAFEEYGWDLPTELLRRYDAARTELATAESAIEDWWQRAKQARS